MALLPKCLFYIAVIGLNLAFATVSFAQDKLLVFVTPNPSIDSVWMADSHGLFKAENLTCRFVLFPLERPRFRRSAVEREILFYRVIYRHYSFGNAVAIIRSLRRWSAMPKATWSPFAMAYGHHRT